MRAVILKNQKPDKNSLNHKLSKESIIYLGARGLRSWVKNLNCMRPTQIQYLTSHMVFQILPRVLSEHRAMSKS